MDFSLYIVEYQKDILPCEIQWNWQRIVGQEHVEEGSWYDKSHDGSMGRWYIYHYLPTNLPNEHQQNSCIYTSLVPWEFEPNKNSTFVAKPLLISKSSGQMVSQLVTSFVCLSYIFFVPKCYDLDVSKNNGTWKWMDYNGKPYSRWWQLKYFYIFTPILGEDEPNLTSIFFRWVGKKHQLDK